MRHKDVAIVRSRDVFPCLLYTSNNISSMRAYVNELDSLNARTQSLLSQIASSWEGEASTAYINIMTERMQKAGQMKELLQEFLSYMEDARTKFVSRDQEGASAIRGC